jgi:hypothetical protein
VLLIGSDGYTQNVIGFDWTNAVHLKFREIAERPKHCAQWQETTTLQPSALSDQLVLAGAQGVGWARKS